MADQLPAPQTPPSARLSSLLAPLNLDSSPPPRRNRSPFSKLTNTSLVIDANDEDEGDSASEEESPIRDREASRWLAKQGRKSLGGDSVLPNLVLSGRWSSHGIVPAGNESRGLNRSNTTRRAHFQDSPAFRRSSSPSFLDAYVPPHLRNQNNEYTPSKPNPYLPSLGKNSLSAFDRSSAPDPEDSFYTFSNESSFALSHFSTILSTPETSREISQSFHSSSKGFTDSPASPRSIHRSSRRNLPSSERKQTTIQEEEELEQSPDVDHDEFDGEEPLGPVLPLASIRERGREVNLSELVPCKVGNEFVEDCSGCGLVPDRSFVIFNPCRHSCCPDCLDSLVNGSAHNPPRPSDCFACSRQVDGFDPYSSKFYASQGGPGIASVLAATLQQEDHKIRTVTARRSPRSSTSHSAKEDELEHNRLRRLSRSDRRRNLVLATAITTTLFSGSQAKSLTTDKQGSSPATLKIPLSASNLKKNRLDLSELKTNLLSLPDDLDTPWDAKTTSSKWSEKTQGVLTPLVDRSASSTHVLEKPPPEGTMNRSARSSLDDSHDEVSFHSPLEVTPCRRTEWPVVRLDNVPWSITADEVEQWLPDGSLASDAGFSPGIVATGEVESVTLAVHILCNRGDGRTLNQAFVECSSVQAARAIVRFRDGTRLRGRPLHVAMSSQSELLTTIFPTYSPGFTGLDALPATRGDSVPCPLLLETELAGLLALCHLDSPHALKVPERPYFNLVSIIGKLPFHQIDSYTSEQVSRLFDACVSAIKTLGDVKGRVTEWRDILTVLVGAVLRCPAFSSSQKKKVVKLAGDLGFVENLSTETFDFFSDQPSSPRAPLVQAPLAQAPSVPSSDPSTLEHASSLLDGVSSATNELPLDRSKTKSIEPSPPPEPRTPSSSDAFLKLLQSSSYGRPSPRSSPCSPIPSPSYVFPPSPSPRTALSPSAALVADQSPRRRRRRSSSIARILNIDHALVVAVAKELGVILA